MRPSSEKICGGFGSLNRESFAMKVSYF